MKFWQSRILLGFWLATILTGQRVFASPPEAESCLSLRDIVEILQVEYCKLRIAGQPHETVFLVAANLDGKLYSNIPLELGSSGIGELLLWAKRETGGIFASGPNVTYDFVFRQGGSERRGRILTRSMLHVKWDRLN